MEIKDSTKVGYGFYTVDGSGEGLAQTFALTHLPALLRGNACILDNPIPLLDFCLQQAFERRGRRSLLLDRRHAELGEAADQGRVLERLLQGADERIHDWFRRVARRIHSVPGRVVPAWI